MVPGETMRFIVNKPNLSREQAEGLLLKPRDRISLDIETVSLENTLPLGIAVGLDDTTGFYFFNPRDEILMELVARTPTILIHNASFDLSILRRLGYTIQNYEDTMLLAYSAGILEKSLEALSHSILGRDCPSVTSQWRKKDQGNIAIDHVKMGGISIIHACNTYALWDKIPKTQLYTDIDRPCIDLVVEMEYWGVLIDQVGLTEVEQATVVRVNKLEQELIQELGKLNLASNPQVVKALQAKGILGTRKTRAGKDSVSEESLKPLNHPIADKVLKWRSLMKTLTTYIPAFRKPDAIGRIHTQFGYTNTGRWSSSKPNLQNITRDDKFDGNE
uniref:Putative DNA polymerase n=1 Tax=viral metagenome TaxID=1070528 RepID=A0A6M3LDL5_9ZZZZ